MSIDQTPGEIWISSDEISVAIRPEAGASVMHLGVTADREDNVLSALDWMSPLPSSRGGQYSTTSTAWLSDFRGGWQVLTPNAGEESELHGIQYPTHGEVSRARWHVDHVAADSVSMSTGTHGPLSVLRTISVVGENTCFSCGTLYEVGYDRKGQYTSVTRLPAPEDALAT